MDSQSTFLATLLFLAASMLVGLAGSIWVRRGRYRRVPGAIYSVLVLLAAAIWIGCYAGELVVAGLTAKIRMNQLAYVGTAFVPPFWLAYVLAYTGYEDRLRRGGWTVILAVPVVTLLLVFTNGLHGLVWSDLTMVQMSGHAVLMNEHGPAFYAFIAYAYVLVGITVPILARKFLTETGIYRRQTSGLFVASIAPIAASILYLTGINPWPKLNLPAVAFTVTALAVAWSVFRHDLFSLTPIAWETAVDQMDDGIIVAGPDDRIVNANPAARRLLGHSNDDLVGRPLAAALDGLIDGPFRDGATYEIDHSDGRHDLQFSTTPLVEDGRRIGRLLVIQDVTTIRARERALARQNERLDEFASVLSHDLRNPLTVASGSLDLARETGDPEHFDRAAAAHDRMEQLIDDVLAVAREGHDPTERKSLSLSQLAHDAWTDTRDATLVVDGDRELVADPSTATRLFENLFRNAIEHGSTSARELSGTTVEQPDSTVTVRVGPTDTGFYVADNGPGIPATDRERVFERGFTTDPDGTGFGLAIVARIADAHGWGIEVGESDAGGARFEITGIES